jgi:hypothetical protein
VQFARVKVLSAPWIGKLGRWLDSACKSCERILIERGGTGGL